MGMGSRGSYTSFIAVSYLKKSLSAVRRGGYAKRRIGSRAKRTARRLRASPRKCRERTPLLYGFVSGNAFPRASSQYRYGKSVPAKIASGSEPQNRPFTSRRRNTPADSSFLNSTITGPSHESALSIFSASAFIRASGSMVSFTTAAPPAGFNERMRRCAEYASTSPLLHMPSNPYSPPWIYDATIGYSPKRSCIARAISRSSEAENAYDTLPNAPFFPFHDALCRGFTTI